MSSNLHRRTLCMLALALLTSARAARADDDNYHWHTEPPPGISATNPLFKLGYLDVTSSKYLGLGVDPSGSRDSTVGLQRAIDDARDYSLIVYFPPGTYAVSDQLRAVQLVRTPPKGGRLGLYPHSVAMVGATRGTARPKIQLRPGSAGFGSSSTPRPLVQLSLEGGGDADSAFNNVFRGIDLDLGGNTGAIGLAWEGAQGSMIEDTTIVATGAVAGIRGISGRGAATVNVKVVGGRNGIIVDAGNGSLGGSLVGIRLFDQTGPALTGQVSRGFAVTGLFIRTAAVGPAVVLTPGSVQASNLFLMDARIEIGGGVAVDNTSGGWIHLRNVYAKGATDFVQDPENSIATGSQAWTRLAEHTYVPGPRGGVASWNLVNGVRSQAAITGARAAAIPPPDLIGRHTWGALPSFEDAGVVNVRDFGAKGDGVTDDRAAIQAAIDASDLVFLPRGEFAIGGPLVLHPTTRLFGTAAMRSRLSALATWQPVTQDWMIKTDDSASATTYLGDVAINNRDQLDDRLSLVLWRAGRNSLVKDISGRGAHGIPEDQARQLFVITGSGGGRWYRWGMGQPWPGTHLAPNPAFRSLQIRDTSEPLTFYGFNPEHAPVSPALMLLRAHNVRILGTKGETTTYDDVSTTTPDGMWIRDSANVLVGAYFVNADLRTNASTLFKLLGTTTDIEIAGAYRESQASTGAVTEQTASATIRGNELVSLFRRGQVDDAVWPTSFPALATAHATTADDEDLPATDDVTTGSDDGAGGCAASSANSGTSGLVLAVGYVMFVLRRRRALDARHAIKGRGHAGTSR